MPFIDLKTGHYRTIIADPPWSFTNFSAKGHAKGPHAQYSCMTLDDLKALPVASLAHPEGSVLVMWATAPMMPEALATMAAWGWTYKTAGAWAKRSKTGAKWAFGTGYVFRSAAEFFLVGTRGKPQHAEPRNRSIRNLIVAPTREHSRKPDDLRMACEALWPGPRCELFGREPVPGWDVFGDQASKFGMQPDLLASQAASLSA